MKIFEIILLISFITLWHTSQMAETNHEPLHPSEFCYYFNWKDHGFQLLQFSYHTIFWVRNVFSGKVENMIAESSRILIFLLEVWDIDFTALEMELLRCTGDAGSSLAVL